MIWECEVECSGRIVVRYKKSPRCIAGSFMNIYGRRLVFLAFGNGNHYAGKSQKSDEVGQYHESVEHVGHVPHQIYLEAGADDDEHDDNGGVYFDVFGSEQSLDVGLTEEIPADDC